MMGSPRKSTTATTADKVGPISASAAIFLTNLVATTFPCVLEWQSPVVVVVVGSGRVKQLVLETYRGTCTHTQYLIPSTSQRALYAALGRSKAWGIGKGFLACHSPPPCPVFSSFRLFVFSSFRLLAPGWRLWGIGRCSASPITLEVQHHSIVIIIL